MSEIDFIIKEVKISQDATFDLTELFKLIKEWYDLHRYDLFEREQLSKETPEGKFPNIKFEAIKKADDYSMFHIEIRMKCSNLKEIKHKKTTLVQGKVELKFQSFIEKDYEDNWEKNFLLKFLRACYDHFIIKGKLDRYEEDLKEETFDIINKTKAFLKLYTYTT